MITSYVFGSKAFDISQILEDKYGQEIAKNVLEKTGPKSLQHTSEDENTLSLAINAGKILIDDCLSSINLSEIKNLISVTETPVNLFPGNGFDIASALNLSKETSIFDLNSGCTGFVDAIRLAFGMHQKSLIVCSETGKLKGLWIPQEMDDKPVPKTIVRLCVEHFNIDPDEFDKNETTLH